MFWNGKIIGVFLGSIFWGPVGAIFGIVLGHLFDIGCFDKFLKRLGIRRAASQQANVQQIFYSCTFTTMGHLAKSDGRVSENEIRAAKSIMERLHLSPAMKKEAIQLFNDGKQTDFNINVTLAHLKKSCWNRPSLLRTFLEIQLQMAYADGQKISPEKHTALQYICSQLGIKGFNFRNFESRYRAQQNYQQTGQSHHPRQHLQDAYKILETNASASDADVKKAYRRQMNKNHPDKLISKGLPPEMIKLANEKTQQIKSAYDTIKHARGL
jgi:DnaJ like chaperone protein